SLLGYTIEGGELVIGPVHVGRGCYVGTRAFLADDTAMEDGARLEDLTLLPRGGRIPAGETWSGAPARRSASPAPVTPPPPRGLALLGQFRATLAMPRWTRALGARLGRFVELSTATSMTPDLLTIADGGTVADEASLGAPTVEGGWMTLAPTRLGRRAFAGNNAVISCGTVLGDGVLVGVQSTAPSDPAQALEPGTTWFGSPADRKSV